MELKNLISNGTNVTYRYINTNVQIPNSYESKKDYLRAAWVSYIVDDYMASTDEQIMKNNLLEVLDTLEEFNMNTIVFHVRTYNNAYYKTKKAPIDPNFGTYESFEKWDYLKWFIDECHNRGIEFHAWLNPYRIKSQGYPEGSTPEVVAKDYKDFPCNPASNPENVLMSLGTGAILNPAKKVVQDYIIDVCLELMENYEIDAIHFDDYFYVQMTKEIDLLNEADQKDYLDFISSHKDCLYKEDNEEDKAQWRRDRVDEFIYNLSVAIRKFNKDNNKHIQFGISPTGIYKNGNGKVTYDSKGNAITSGSNTLGQAHYKSYLFCDTKKWVDEEWIDYIIPQSYWGFTHPVAGFADVMDWWNKVVEHKNVNLYAGMGVYMSYNPLAYSWANDEYEASNEVLYCTKLNNVKGTCIFSYKAFVRSKNNEDSKAFKGLQRIKNEYWTEKVKTPTTMASK